MLTEKGAEWGQRLVPGEQEWEEREREAGVERVKTLAVGKASLFTRECSECAQGCS